MKQHSVGIILIFLCLICSINVSAQNAGEIVFSKTSIDPANPSGLATEFNAGDPIYAVAYFENNILGMGGKSTAKNVIMEIFIYEIKPPLYDYQQPSEMQLETSSLTISGDAMQKKYLPLDIVPNANAMTAYGNPDLMYKKFGPKFAGPVKFAERLSELEAGDHTILVKVNCNYNFVSEGKFIIKGDDYSVYQKMSDALNEAASSSKTKTVMMPKAAMTDKNLEAEMITAFKGSQTYKDRIGGEVMRISIIDPDWMIRRNTLTGVILHRYIRAGIAVKNSDGTCTLWQLVTFQQDYVGDKFGPTKFDGVGDPLKIPCENVSK